MRIKKSEGLKLYGQGRLTATVKGTRRYGVRKIVDIEGQPYFAGRPILNSGIVVAEMEIDNLIVTLGKGLVGDMLIDKAGYDTGLTWQAIGTGVTAPALGDTQLTTETARKAITSRTRSGNVVTFSTFFTAAESTYNIKEAGVFGHSTASAAANSGVLASHWLVSFDNSGGLYDITLDLTWSLG